MAEQPADELPRDVVFTSETYRQDFVNAVMYAVIGVGLLVGTLFWFAFLGSSAGTAGASGAASTTPLSFGQAMGVGRLCGYLLSFFTAMCFFVAGYSGVVRPLQRATGRLESAGSTDASPDEVDHDQETNDRVVVHVTTTEGIQRFVPETDCAECEQLATAVLAAAFEDETPTRAVPLCPEHLGERREVLEDGPSPIEIESFSRSAKQ